VCFTTIDRSARRLKYFLEIWDALDEAGTVVHVIEPTIDTSTHIGRHIRTILGSIATSPSASPCRCGSARIWS
jgi:DNA invertase Pin-like site-specific DNA recombinase